ncbi:MAG: tetratricopeptide repeat protein [Candidatus Omnitrophica bacterium]|nr:tetratricopeptide repeat protein [Candidatus Omnitrophota bacterium]
MRSLFFTVLLLALSTHVWADVVQLKSGKVLHGNIIDETDFTIKIETHKKVWILKKSLIENIERRYDAQSNDIISDAPDQNFSELSRDNPEDNNAAFDDPKAAIVYWEALIQDDPQQAEAYAQIGIAYNRLEQPNRAIPYFQKAIALSPMASECYNNLAFAYMLLGQYEQAEMHIKRAINIEPQYVEAIGNYGYITIGLKRYLEAINLFKVAIASNPDNPSYYKNLAYAYKQIGEGQKAKESLLKAKKIYQKNGNFDGMRVVDYQLSRLDISKAESHPLSVLTRPLGPSFDGRVWEMGFRKEKPDSRITEYVLMGETVEDWNELVTVNEFFGLQKDLNAGQFMRAIKNNLTKICKEIEWREINSTYHDVLYRFNARQCQGQADFFEIARIILTVDRIYTMHYASKRMLTTDKIEQWSEILTDTLFSGTQAFDSFTRKDKVSLSKKKDTLDMGVKLLEQKQYDSAIIFFKSLLAADRNNIDVLYFLARAYLESGSVEEAQTLLLRANNLSPYEPDVNVMLGETYIEMGQFDQARNYFDRAQSLYAELGIDDVVQEIGELLIAIDPEKLAKAKERSFIQVLRRSRQEGDGLWLVILVGPAFFVLYFLDILFGVRIRRRLLGRRERKILEKLAEKFNGKVKDVVGQTHSIALYYYQEDYRIDIQSIFRRPKSCFSSTAGYYDYFLSVQTNTQYCLVCIPSVGKTFIGRRMNVLSKKALVKSRKLIEVNKDTMPSFCQLFKIILTNDEEITRRIFEDNSMRSLMFEKASMLVEIDKGAVIVPLSVPFKKGDESVKEIDAAVARLFPVAKVISA